MNLKKLFPLAILSAFAGVAGIASIPEKESQSAQAIEDRTDAYILESTLPKYPPEMLQRGIQGRTLLMLRVDEHGEVDKVRVVASTNQAFSDAAARSVRDWYFAPGTREGVSVAQTVVVPIDFVIEDPPTADVASL